MLSRFPSEILLKKFRSANYEDLRAIALVNKKWKSLTRHVITHLEVMISFEQDNFCLVNGHLLQSPDLPHKIFVLLRNFANDLRVLKVHVFNKVTRLIGYYYHPRTPMSSWLIRTLCTCLRSERLQTISLPVTLSEDLGYLLEICRITPTLNTLCLEAKPGGHHSDIESWVMSELKQCPSLNNLTVNLAVKGGRVYDVFEDFDEGKLLQMRSLTYSGYCQHIVSVCRMANLRYLCLPNLTLVEV